MSRNSNSQDNCTTELFYKEVDEPFEDADIKKLYTGIQTLKNNEVTSLEEKANYADRMDKHRYKKYGLDLMIGCGIAYIALVIFDTVTCNIWSWKTSELMTGLIELLKFVVSTLIGFVFSESKKKD